MTKEIETSLFTASVVEEHPADGAQYFFSSKGKRPRDGICVRVRCGSVQWSGIFGFGETKFSTLCRHPDPQELCVISGGSCYFLKVQRPELYAVLTAFATGCAFDQRSNQLIVHDDWRIYCVRESGVAWVSEIDSDGIRNLSVSSAGITCEADVLGSNNPSIIRLDPETGRILL